MPIGHYAPAADLMWKLSLQYDLDPSELFRNAGINPEMMNDPNARLSFSQAAGLWQQLEMRITDPAFALHTVDIVKPFHLGALGHAWIASINLRTALLRLERYGRVVTDHRAICFIETSNEYRIELGYDDSSQAYRSRTTAMLAALLAMMRWRLGNNFVAQRVEVTFQASSSQQAFSRCFGCPLVFGGERDAITIASSILDQPLPGGDSHLAQINEQYLVKVLSALDKDDLGARVQALILAELPTGTVHMEAVAKQLHVSARTMQRKLAALGSSFSQLLDTTRREYALALVRNSAISFTEIAFSSGFNSLSHFSSAVKQWTGLSPSNYRKQLVE